MIVSGDSSRDWIVRRHGGLRHPDWQDHTPPLLSLLKHAAARACLTGKEGLVLDGREVWFLLAKSAVQAARQAPGSREGELSLCLGHGAIRDGNSRKGDVPLLDQVRDRDLNATIEGKGQVTDWLLPEP